MPSKWILLIEFVAAGLVLAAIGLPLILRWIRPNRWYGLGRQSALQDPDRWYAANADAGKRLAAAGLTIATGAVLFYFMPKWQLIHYAVANLAVTLLALAYAILQTLQATKGQSQQSQPAEKPPEKAAAEPAEADDPAQETTGGESQPQQ